MECKKCGSTWNVSPDKAIRITKCPFCGSDLSERTIESQIRIMVQESGPEVLTNAMKINSILADLFPGAGRERTTIRSALDIGAGRMFYEIALNSDLELDARIRTVRHRLMEEAWLSEKACDYVCAVFLGAINVTVPVSDGKEAQKEIQPAREETDAGDRKMSKKTIHRPALQTDAGDRKKTKKAADKATPETGQKAGEPAGEVGQNQAERLYRAAMWQLERGQTQIAAWNLQKVADGGKLEILANRKLGELSRDQPELAVTYYSRAAELGDSEAQNIVGYMYENGEGVEKNLAMAVKYYELAAENHHRGAQHNLGVLYYMGTGVPRDYSRAYDLFLAAAWQESPGAQNNLGVMFEYGHGVARDRKRALHWYQKAAHNGSEDGRDNYERLLKQIE